MILFETDKKPLTFLLDQIENRELALPDFQRSFVWDAGATRELVASIISSFPAGSLLIMQGGSKIFKPRAFEEAPDLGDTTPSYLVLDGQQRLTSLSQAFAGRGTHRFFLNLGELLEGEGLDEAVEVYIRRRAKRWQKREAQAQDLMLPLAELRSFADWRDDVLDLMEEQNEDVKKLRRRLNELEQQFVRPVELYQFPVTTLSATTPVEAVCTIFETLNRTGVKLSVFELITARAFAHDVRLRELWEKALQKHPVIQDFEIDPYYILQSISLMVHGSPKRNIVLGLRIEDIVETWDSAVIGMAETLKILRDECGVLVGKWLPYATMLNTMAAVWRAVDSVQGPKAGACREKLKQWFWCSVFAGEYDNAPNSTTERDVPELREWLEGGPEPTAVRTFSFDPARWSETTVRQRAQYRGTIALLMSHAPRDFHEATRLSKPIIDGKEVDDHHVFPRAFLKSERKDKMADSVLNHTLIDRKTNIRIGGRAPSEYLAEMRTHLRGKLPGILSSHGLPPEEHGPLFEDRFEDFLAWRIDYLTRELEDATGRPVGTVAQMAHFD